MQCPECDGDGYNERLDQDLVYSMWMCPACDGKGVVDPMYVPDRLWYDERDSDFNDGM